MRNADDVASKHFGKSLCQMIKEASLFWTYGVEMLGVAERRKSYRRRIYVGDKIEVDLVIGDRCYTGHVIDISVGGYGIILNGEECNEVALTCAMPLTVVVKAPKCRALSVVANIVHVGKLVRLAEEYLRLGISLENSRTDGFIGDDRRSRRFRLEKFHPMASFHHPIFFRNTLHLQIVEVSAAGITCLASESADVFVVGLLLDLKVSFASGRTVAIKTQLVHTYVSHQHAGKLVVGFAVLNCPRSYREFFSNCIVLNDETVSFDALRDSGFIINDASGCVNFGTANPQEMNAIAELRLISKRAEASDGADLTRMVDSFDAHSRHIVGRINRKIVSTSRLIFNNGNRSKSEYTRYNTELPDWLWDEGFAEAGRLVVHPEYRRANLFIHTLQAVGLTATSAGYRYVVLSSNPNLMRLYKSVGAKVIGTFSVDEEQSDWVLYYMDMQKCVKGYYSGPIVWSFFHKPLLDIAITKCYVKVNILEKARIRIFRSIGKTVDYLQKVTSKRN